VSYHSRVLIQRGRGAATRLSPDEEHEIVNAENSVMWSSRFIQILTLIGTSWSITIDDLVGTNTAGLSELAESGVIVIEDAIRQDVVQRLSEALSACSVSGSEPDIYRSRSLDGSLRATFASRSNDVFDQCSEEARLLAREYKLITQEIGLKVAKFLDSLSPRAGLTLETLIGSDDSGSLDHFHVYHADEDVKDTGGSTASVTYSVPFHVDMGLFLLLTPATWVNNSENSEVHDSDLIVKRKDGTIFEIAPKSPGSVIMLCGAGLSNWLYQGTSGLRAAVHAVNPISTVSASRVVLGRMFLPPMDTISESGIRFEDFFMSSSKVINSAPVDQSSVQWRRLMEARCEAGTKYCWMDCMPDVDCGDGSESMCMNPITGKVCLDTDCDTDCTVMCPPRPPTLTPVVPVATATINGSNTSTSAGIPTQGVTRASQQGIPVAVTVSNDPVPFCRGGTSMVMSGFESVGSTNANCIILFFRPWLLDCPWKFGIGCLGVFLLGILVEAAIKLRRYATNKMDVHNRFWREFVVIGLFAVNVALGYLCMLAAMTFNVEIFISTVMGLAVGHLLLGNSSQPVRETADPCCVTSEANNTGAVTTTLVNSTGACCCDTRPSR